MFSIIEMYQHWLRENGGGNELDSGSRDCGKSSPNKDTKDVTSKNMQSQRCLYVELSVQMLGKERLILLILT